MRMARHIGLVAIFIPAFWLLLGDGGRPAAQAVDRVERPADGFGYTAAFHAELQRIGQISPAEFAARRPAPAYLAQLSWDPTTARFWDEFNQSEAPRASQQRPYQPKASFREKPRHYVWYDFRPNAEELARFKANGFVVSERMGAASFGELFYRIYSRDLPVFISADSILHAWHRSYDAMLEELEATYLSAALADLLAGMADALPAARAEYGHGPLAESILDADYFLAVARSLLAGRPMATQLKQEARLAHTLRAINALQMQEFVLFGRERSMDFSQFKPRGHYEKSEELRRYFRAMMWCGRIDLRVAGGRDAHGELSSPRELGAALVLHDLLRRSGKYETWRQFDALLQALVGRADSATFAHLDALLREAGLPGAAALQDAQALEALQADILAGKFGLQEVRGDVYINVPHASQPIQMPRSFTLLGQRFAVDSWALAKVVYDDIKWNDELVPRRIPSALDVAFAVLGNDHVVPDLVQRMTVGPHRFRDRENYQHNLLAVRNVVDRRPSAAWEGTVYDCWLAALRELSHPTTEQLPEAMRTRAWAMKGLNTQLASWTQLRHDNILYVKPSYTDVASCYYPAGFVEPVPAFWEKLEAMLLRHADLLETVPFPPRLQLRVQARQVRFLRSFAAQVRTLREIAVKQLEQKELTADEKKVLEEVIQANRGSGFTKFDGWYPWLFYTGPRTCADWEPLVADVHTDPPDPFHGDPGCILHQGVGNVDLLLIAIDNGTDRVVYAGPVFSHYEFETPLNDRRSDSEWRALAVQGKLPPRPEWTRSYLVPGVNPDAKHYARPRVDE